MNIKDTIYNMDCLEGMRLLPDNCIDAGPNLTPPWALTSPFLITP